MAEKEAKKVEQKGKDDLITAVYKLSLHCPECAREIRRPLLRTQGVHSVEVSMEKGEIMTKGSFDPIKIQKRLEKITKKKIELISPTAQIKETIKVEKIVVKETKQAVTRTTSIKVHMHCDQCERDIKKKLIKQTGIHSVKTDMKAQILTVDGTIEPEKLVYFLRRKGHKLAEIIPPKAPEKKEEKKEIISIKEEIKVMEVKPNEGDPPYSIHYVYAPQLFSDENPNACTIT